MDNQFVIGFLDTLAARRQMTRQQLIAKYESKDLPKEDLEMIDELLREVEEVG